ncbi:MAG: TetR/AcrR family transcriptional regulator [Nevskia sp.]|nr:TetR/AcrR family transcriptional regulator [Nevskia sp.]
MRYPSTHKAETRRKLVENARAIAKKGGFEATGVDAFMQGIGLSGAAFYNHFESKQALFAAIVAEEARHSVLMLSATKDGSAEAFVKTLHGYLSSFHALNPGQGCALAALGPELARAAPEVKALVEQGLRDVQESWSERLGDSDAAWSLISQCVGALVLSRMVESGQTRKEILSANRRSVERAAGL